MSNVNSFLCAFLYFQIFLKDYLKLENDILYDFVNNLYFLYNSLPYDHEMNF